jgi:hypothetical protein
VINGERPSLRVSRYPVSSPLEAYKTTIKLIGQGIRDGSTFFPLRQYAAGLATTAGPKDYFGQVGAIFDDFTKNKWRYVKEPGEIVATSGRAIWQNILGAAARTGQRGHGDCDDATAALGALFSAIGLPVQIVTSAPVGAKTLFTHVYPRVHIPRVGWIAADAVGYPTQPLGWQPPALRRAIWDLDGKLIAVCPNSPAMQGLAGTDETEKKKGANMPTEYPDYGLDRFGLAGTDAAEPLEFAGNYAPSEFGAYSPVWGLHNIYDDTVLAEVDDDDTDAMSYDGSPLVRTRILEMDPRDYAMFQATGSPRMGAVALADDGTVYQWTQEGLGRGFFKKLFKRIKGAVKKVAKKVSGIAKKIIKKLPGGKYLLKIYGKIRAVAMKLVKPLMKFVGKYAKKLAPIAALIPGYGPAIAAALYTAGKIATVMQATGVMTDKKTGRPKFKSPQHLVAFKKTLEKEAEKAKRTGLVSKQIAAAKKRRATPRQIIQTAAPIVARVPRPWARRIMQPGTAAHAAYLRGLGADVEYYQ